jgi:hypothetical protein
MDFADRRKITRLSLSVNTCLPLHIPATAHLEYEIFALAAEAILPAEHP